MRVDVIVDPDLSAQEMTEFGLLAEKVALKLRGDRRAIIETFGEPLVPVLMDSQ